MSVDFTEKAKRYQAIDEIIASGRNSNGTKSSPSLPKNTASKRAKLPSSATSKNCRKNTPPQSTQILKQTATSTPTPSTGSPDSTRTKTPQRQQNS